MTNMGVPHAVTATGVRWLWQQANARAFYINFYCVYCTSDHLPLMKTLDWVETSGNLLTSDICLSNEPVSGRGVPQLSVMSIATHSEIFNAIM